jgi:hypothetical protein
MADADLTQFNRVAADAEAANAADALTSQLLLITDGKKIVGETNSAGKAPVNRGTKALALMIAGLRGALFGNVTGIAKRSVKSFYADGTGGATHTKPDGNIHAANNLVAETGDVMSSAGAVEATAGPLRAGTAAGERCYTDKSGVHFATISTGSSGANPPKTEVIPNQYRALNSIKYWIVFETDGSGGITNLDASGGATLTIASSKIVVSFPLPDFDNTHYAVFGNGGSAGSAAAFHCDPADKAVGSCKFKLGSFDPATTALYGQVMICGRQTT